MPYVKWTWYNYLDDEHHRIGSQCQPILHMNISKRSRKSIESAGRMPQDYLINHLFKSRRKQSVLLSIKTWIIHCHNCPIPRSPKPLCLSRRPIQSIFLINVLLCRCDGEMVGQPGDSVWVIGQDVKWIEKWNCTIKFTDFLCKYNYQPAQKYTMKN